MAAVTDLQWYSGPAGPLKSRSVVDISTTDYTDDRGFLVEAATAGDLTYRPLIGAADQTQTVTAGGYPSVAGVPVICTAVRSSTSTVTSVVVGHL